MGFDLGKRIARPRAMPAVAPRVGLLALAAFLFPGVAMASWDHGGSGNGYSKARSLPAGNTPTTSISGRNVIVSWSASSFAGGGPSVSDYTVKRYDTGGAVQSIGANCSGTISALTCTENNVDPGSWKYSVTPKAGNNWVGTESSQSATRVVDPPSFTLSSWGDVTSLPSTVNGDLASFKTGATVTYRLDNPTTGTVLSATTTPSTIGTNGAAGVGVTIPTGTSSGEHTIYAIGSSGDQASAEITVTVCSSPGAQTVTANADTTLQEDQPTNNFGGAADFKVKSKPAANKRGLVGFNLPSVPSGCAVTSASLQLYETVVDTTRTILARRATSSWAEGTVTWNTKPTTTSAGEASTTSALGTRTWSATQMVKNMYTDGNYGFELRDSAEGDAADLEQKFQGHADYPDSQDPKLVITFGADTDATYTLTSSSTLTSLPTSLNGKLRKFTAGSTLTYRLDDPTSGTVLSGTTTPSTIGVTGRATNSVTVPEGVSQGAHKIYAISSSGDVARVDITVNLPTITTPAWALSDVSSGTAVDQSDATAFDDNRLFPADAGFAAVNFSAAFASNRFYQWDYNSSLVPGLAASNVNFNFRFQSNAGAEVACFYFDVIDGGTTIGTHGSTTPAGAGTPWCTDSTEKLVTTALPEVTTSDIANGLRIKVYGAESNNKPIKVDLATISGTVGGQTFTLNEMTGVNQADTSAETLPWTLGFADAVFFTNATSYASSFTSTKYTGVTFPSGYLPSSADLEAVSFVHTWQSINASTVCYYLDVFSGGSSIGTVPASPADLSCATGTASWVTDTIPLPMVDTPAEINGGVQVRIVYRTSNGGATKAREDYTGLSIVYD